MQRFYKKELKISGGAAVTHIKKEAAKHSAKKRRGYTKSRSNAPGRLEVILKIKEAFGSAKSILCIGCRDDSEVLSFIDAGFKAHGADISIKTKNITKVSAERLDEHFDDNSYDLIFACHSLEHVIIPELALKNIRKVSALGCYITLPHVVNHKRNKPTRGHPTIFDIMMASHEDLESLQSVLKLLNADFKNFEPYDLIDFQYGPLQDEFHLFFKWTKKKKKKRKL